MPDITDSHKDYLQIKEENDGRSQRAGTLKKLCRLE